MLLDRSATVLVTGATGFVGRVLLAQLVKRGCKLRVFSRPSDRATILATEVGATLIEGELTTRALAREACAGVSHIFHLASNDDKGNQRGTAQNCSCSNVEGTRTLATVAGELSNPPRFVFVSSAAIHGDTGSGVAGESSPYCARTDYELAKLEAELWLQRFSSRRALELTILRPSAIIGPNDQRLLKLFRLASRRLIFLPGCGRNNYQIIHVDDFTRLLLATAESSAAAGETYLCANAETLRLRTLVELIAESGSRPKGKLVGLPYGAVKMTAQLLDSLSNVVGVELNLSERLQFFTTQRSFDTKKLASSFGTEVQKSHSNARAVADVRRWYDDQRWL